MVDVVYRDWLQGLRYSWLMWIIGIVFMVEVVYRDCIHG